MNYRDIPQLQPILKIDAVLNDNMHLRNKNRELVGKKKSLEGILFLIGNIFTVRNRELVKLSSHEVKCIFPLLETLLSDIDLLMQGYEKKDPVFFQNYFRARIIFEHSKMEFQNFTLKKVNKGQPEI